MYIVKYVGWNSCDFGIVLEYQYSYVCDWYETLLWIKKIWINWWLKIWVSIYIYWEVWLDVLWNGVLSGINIL